MSVNAASQQASTSRQALTSRQIGSSESTIRIRNGIIPSSHQFDPLIESLDEQEEVEVWLNDVINSRRALFESSPSALQLRVGNVNDTDLTITSWAKLTNLESQLSSLSSTLSFARQDTTSIIDSTISNVTTTIPKLGLELRLMKDAALTLKGSIDNLRIQALQRTAGGNNDSKELSSLSSSTSTASAALERLSALSTLHSKMTSARDVLSLAESWSTLSADVSSYLGDKKYSQACSRLVEAKTSLAVFERTPEYEARKILLEGLCNSLVTSISPLLEDAAKGQNVMEAQRIGGILSAIGRGNDFAEYWRKARTSSWLAQWKLARLDQEKMDENDEKGSATLFSQSLQHSLDNFLVLLNDERLHAPILFPKNPRKSIAMFASSAFLALDPTLESRLSPFMQSNNRQAIILLVQVHLLIKNAVAGISRILGKIEEVNEYEDSPVVVPNGHSLQASPAISPLLENKPLYNTGISPVSPIANRPRQGSQSRRMSGRRLSANVTIPRKMSGSASDIFLDTSVKQSVTDPFSTLLPEVSDWELGLLEPLLNYQMKYADMERRFLSEERERESLASEAALRINLQGTPSSTLLGSHIWKCLREDFKICTRLAEDSLTRCLSLTFGLASDDLVSCVDEIFATSLSKFETRLEQRSSEVIASARKQARGRLDGGIDGHHISSSSEDDQWKAFQESVELLSILHQCEQVVNDRERNVAEGLKDTAELILNGTLSVGNEALLRLCGQGTTLGVCKAPLSILVRHDKGKLQSGSLINTLENILTLLKDARISNEIDRRQALFNKTRLSLFQQLKSVQRHLIDMTLAPLLSHMEFYTQLPIWEATRLPGSVNEYELAMPTFSLSPTEEMSRIGEGLLDLPRLLEVWSDNVHLRWAVSGLPHLSSTSNTQAAVSEQQVEGQTLSALNSSLAGNRMSFQASSTSPTTERRTNHHRHSMSLAAIATVPADSISSSTPADEGSNSVLQTYLSSIALSLLSQLTSLVLPSISKLTLAGSLQLVADLEYLLNILSALNVNSSTIAAITSVSHTNDEAVHLIRILEAWKDSCKFNNVDGKRIANFVKSGQLARGLSLSGIEGFQDDEDRLNSLASTQAFEMVARLRGW